MRGLPSLLESRQRRRRALVLGKATLGPGLPKYTWLWIFVALGVVSVVYFWRSSTKLSEQKSVVAAEQRVLEQELGVKLAPFIARVERAATELAAEPWPGPHVVEGAELLRVRTAPGVYLRAPLSAAREPDALRAAALRSLHDGFVACFFEGPARPRGADCQRSADCAEGEVCTVDASCSPPVEPYNFRLALRAERVLTPEWSQDLKESTNDLQVRTFETELKRVARSDVPIAERMLGRAEFLTVVLDEAPEGGVPEALPPSNPGEPEEFLEERIQREPHFARVGIWELGRGELLYRERLFAGGRLVGAGARSASTDARNQAALARQANSCALGGAVRASLAKAAEGGAGDASSQATPPTEGARGL